MSNPCKLTQEELKGDLIDRCKACGYFNHQHGFSNPSPTVSDEELKRQILDILVARSGDKEYAKLFEQHSVEPMLALIHNKQREARTSELQALQKVCESHDSEFAFNLANAIEDKIQSLTSEDNK